MAGEYPHARGGDVASSPQVMSGYINKNMIAGAHITPSGGALAFTYDTKTGVYQTIDLFTVQGNRLQLPLFDGTDEHYCLAVFVDYLDRLHVIGNAHDALSNPSNTMHHVQCQDMTNFTSAANWITGAEPGSALDNEPATTGIAGGTYTYHYFDRLTNGEVLWFMSQSPARDSSRGRCVLAYRYGPVSGSPTYTPLVDASANNPSGSKNDAGRFAISFNYGFQDGHEADRVYVLGCQIVPQPNGTDELYVAGIWRTLDEDATSQQKPWLLHANSSNWQRWRAMDGTIYDAGASAYPSTTPSMPISWYNAPAATITSAPALCSTGYPGPWVGDPNQGGSPSVIAGSTTLGIMRLYWDGTTWQSEPASTIPGQHREITIKGQRWTRGITTGRTAFRLWNTSNIIRTGGGIRTGVGQNFSPSWDPIWARERGICALNIGDGATPKIWTWPTLTPA